MNHFFTAKKIHNGLQFLKDGAVIESDDMGLVVAIHDEEKVDKKLVKHYDGIVCPGFINAHCHLELSHLKNTVDENTGLVQFVLDVMKHRNQYDDTYKKEMAVNALYELQENGVVAIGDICNTNDVLELRLESDMHFHSFIECIGFNDSIAQERFHFSESVYKKFLAQQSPKKILSQSIVPHAPYSVSKRLFEMIDAYEIGNIISIHNEETAAENEYFETKTGDIKKLLATLKINDSYFQPAGTTTLKTYLPYFSKTHSFILVHNTFMQMDDLEFLACEKYNIFLCLCPNANWYIERKMPPVLDFIQYNFPICIGTDSLASNYSLSVFDELKTLHHHFPEITWEILLQWATYNGAKALQMDYLLGRIHPGKRPGFCLINNEMTEVNRLKIS